MKTIFLTYIFILFVLNSNTQCVGAINLIPNPSFEVNTISCTGSDNQLYSNQSPVLNWFGTEPFSGSAGSTPDYSNNNASTCGVDLNSLGQATCFVGNKSLGLFVYTPGVNGREYIQAALNTPLITGQLYCFSMRVRSNTLLGNNTDGIGAHFRNSGVINIMTANGNNQFLGPGSILNMIPQIQNPNGNIIGSTCTTVTGTFTALGGENRIIIGNFKPNSTTTVSNSTSPSYMIVDDLKLFEITPLSVLIKDENVGCVNKKTLIQWSTEYESNNDFFVIEKSCDGINYELIEKIKGKVNSDELNFYSFQFESDCDDINYIRLLQTDLDGVTNTLFETSLKCNNQTTNVIYNHLSSELVLYQTSNKVKTLKVFDLSGKLIVDFSSQIDFHENKQSFNLSLFSSGYYYLEIENITGEFQYIPLYYFAK